MTENPKYLFFLFFRTLLIVSIIKRQAYITSDLVTQNFTVKPVSQTLLRGDTALFNCRSEGHPPPKVSWKLVRPVGPGEIIEKSIFTKYSNNSLVLQNVQNKDEGQYVCISESPGLKVNVTASLLVHSKSVFSSYIRTFETNVRGQQFTVLRRYIRIGGLLV